LILQRRQFLPLSASHRLMGRTKSLSLRRCVKREKSYGRRSPRNVDDADNELLQSAQRFSPDVLIQGIVLGSKREFGALPACSNGNEIEQDDLNMCIERN
jgi:hypothetical protein